MSTARVTVTIEAPISAVFDFVDEPSNTPRYMRGIERYEPLGTPRTGKGAVYDSRAVVVGRNFDVQLEVTEWIKDRSLVAVSRKGPKTRGAWHFEKLGRTETAATLVYDYDLPMVFRFIPGANGVIEDNLRKSLARLKTLVEAEPQMRPRRPSPRRASRGAK